MHHKSDRSKMGFALAGLTLMCLGHLAQGAITLHEESQAAENMKQVPGGTKSASICPGFYNICFFSNSFNEIS